MSSSLSKRKIGLVIILVIAILLLLRVVQTGISMVNVLNHTYVQETDTFLGYMLTKNNKPYLIRCEKEVKNDSSIYQKYEQRISTIINFHSSKNGLPPTQDRKALDKFETSFINKIIAQKELGLGGYIIGGSKEEIFLYTKNPEKLKKIFKTLQTEFPSYKLTFETKADKSWAYYNAYCIKKQFPS